MGAAFVLGNGISRQGIDLDKARNTGPIYGCNALYRDYTPDCLIATDTPIAEAIQHSGYAQKNRFHTRNPLPGLGAKRVPQKYHGYSSGPLAVGIAAHDKHNVIYLLGFDLGPTLDNRFNNIYASTEFYKSAAAVPTYTRNWVNQIIEISKDFPHTQFTRIMGKTTAHVEEFKNSHNIHAMNMEEFLKRLTITHDL